MYLSFFFFNVPSTTEIYTYVHTLSLHDALPIGVIRIEFAGCGRQVFLNRDRRCGSCRRRQRSARLDGADSDFHLVDITATADLDAATDQFEIILSHTIDDHPVRREQIEAIADEHRL